MNCQEFWNALPLVGDAAALANQEHTARCPACAARLRNQLALQTGLRAMAGQMSRMEAPARVEARLRTAFRAHAGLEPGGSRFLRPRTRWMPVLTWASATVALLALALFLVRGRQPEPAPPVASRGAELAMAGMPADESGFIALPNAAQIGPNEEVNMVRVEVPRSAMIALGYDVKPEEASQPVQADVMLGNDGLARAVRFLD